LSTAISFISKIAVIYVEVNITMARYDRGDLSRFVRQVMKEKGLTQRDVELRSDGKITDGYVADILSGDAKNPSVEKVKALARGLDVNVIELFRVACGPCEQSAMGRERVVISEVAPFLEMMLEVADSPELIKIVQEAIKLYPEERAVLLQSAETFNRRKRKPQGRQRLQRGEKRA
jgi:transcriptional regulator with XRE-family HTH domain